MKMKKTFVKYGSALTAALLPVLALAAEGPLGCTGDLKLKTLITCLISDILNPLVYVIMGLAVITFLNGALKYIRKGDNKEEREKGSQFMTYGIIALAVMVSVWGLVNIVTGFFFGQNLPTSGPIPTIHF